MDSAIIFTFRSVQANARIFALQQEIHAAEESRSLLVADEDAARSHLLDSASSYACCRTMC